MCSVCFSTTLKPPKRMCCTRCKDYTCMSCISKILNTCDNGCDCVQYTCPTCREAKYILISDINNVEMLRGIIESFRVCIKDANECSILHEV